MNVKPLISHAFLLLIAILGKALQKKKFFLEERFFLVLKIYANIYIQIHTQKNVFGKINFLFNWAGSPFKEDMQALACFHI